MLIQLLILAVLQFSACTSQCTYSQELEEGQTYYAYNPNYPNEYEGENHCEWVSTSSGVITVNCTMELPASADCAQDILTIQGKMGPPKRYCGNGQIAIQEPDAMKITFDAPYNSTGGKFLCEISSDKRNETKRTDEPQHCKCGWTNPKKIVGGKETGANEYPMMAGLVDATTKMLYCGATIINTRQVITSASCLEARDINTLAVLVGEHDTRTGLDTNATKLFRMASATIHPDYSGDTDNIAVVTIAGTIPFSANVGPVCLPFQHAPDSFAGQFVDVLGWGLLEFGGEKATTLQKVELNVLTNYECKGTYADLSDSQICTLTPGKDACQMDTGGPLIWRNKITKRLVLIGIIQSGVGCASNAPSLNTKIGSYMEWIKSQSPDASYCVEE